MFEEGEKLGLWRFVLLEGERIAIPPADVYILGAWSPDYEKLLNTLLPAKVGVLWTSSIGEMDFTPIEWNYLYAILQDPRISFIWFGCEALARLFPQKGFYAPYPLAPMEAPQVEKRDIMTLFCPGGPKKNLGNQLAAVALVQRERPEMVLHTNVERYEPIMRLLNINYVLHPWLPREEYHRLLASARVNLAVSWAETFDYNVAEAALLGTPSVLSTTVTLPGGRFAYDPNDPQEIADAIAWVTQHPDSGVAEKMRHAADTFNNTLAVMTLLHNPL